MAGLHINTNQISRTVADLPGPPGLPLLGNLFQMAPAKLHLTLERWARQYGSPFRVQLGTIPITVWTEADLFQTVMRERPNLYRRFSPIESAMTELGGNGLFSAEGPAWEPQRRLIMRALSFSNIKAFYPALSSITQRFLVRLQSAAKENRTLEMADELKRYTVDVTSTLAFGEDPHTLEQERGVIQEQLALILPALMRRVTALFPYWHYVSLPEDRRLARAMVEVHGYIKKMIERAQDRMRQSPDSPPHNLLEAMLAARNEPDSTVTNELVSANVLTLLVAGEDTTANAIAWALMYIAADLPLQHRLFEQSSAALGGSPVCPDYDALKHLDLCEAVCSEALRLRPVAAIQTFEPLSDVCLDGVAIPAGTRMFFLTRPSMLDPQNFVHPEVFNPDRWKHPRDPSDGAHEQKTYLTFGAGPRVCPGRYLAGVEMRLVISMLMKHFRVELAIDPEEIEEISAFTMVPNRMPVKLHPVT
ncbi:cytochrome P450 [Paraburkholderia caribensis]|uniref:Cytochrome P450 n=2 Tax=Pseudomonadota TaxID=1224 RepID=A0A9Q6S8H3_9BURK|nr:cytochrome P450 [Paraburkholderia caribensis]MCO4876972.1 cytochrome P450 [Paraburkholderia caribensis]PTB30854.1 cytochrome P450 [Paraburkholderia caribensis]QLB66448.1 cytochrome P450 [Paraburkholderia caribensis]